MVLNDKMAPAPKTTVMVGGVALNKAFVNALKSRSGIDFVIPEDTVFGGAIGAALIAMGNTLQLTPDISITSCAIPG